MRKETLKKFLNVINSKPVIGLGIFVMLSLAMVFAGNIFVKEGNLNVTGELSGVSKISFDQGTNFKIDTNADGLLFDGGDGNWDFLVYDDNVYTDNLKTGYSGSALITTYDSNEDLTIDPNGSGKTNIEGNLSVDKIYSLEGTITATSATQIITNLQRGEIYQIYASGRNTDYAGSEFGYGSWIVFRIYDGYDGGDAVKVLPLFSTTYTDKIVVSASGYNVNMQYDGAGAGNNTLYWSALRVR